ncbi:MAG: polysaccharide deacetylase family protein [Floccifex porci]|uniref:Polysaccharide deacetylase family protein n=1 Tax=Floccifex porci TaxID=2606629 RepID=A0A7X2N1K5_9FIRM|nr:polysaccharide deacetylase family protein [Floccifex porci]MCI7802406.1 polysaccharide deacetylase family protein [Erysipelotrichaceae bacterium]MDD7467543.1 polysaccharide deacetylase family protein [Floccifex porci]MDO4480394.1 polysaccharide deacetylase family protein [Erysipelotrichaceae bacterium]MDY4797152.1 polysaccharide deacetylase family protein [Floccifex porci]MSS00742.1 polysaccharide deacetylase family protein [Floccifex porci]
MKKRYLIILSLFLIISCLYTTRDSIPVLGYHNIVKDEEKEKISDRYTLSQSQFMEQMQYLYDHQYQTLTLDEFYECYTTNKQFPKKSIVLTFDDGYASINTIVKPILKQFNFQASCFVIGKHCIDDKEQFVKLKDMINDETISFYSHSYNLHRFCQYQKIIETLSFEQIEKDFDKNKVDHTYFAYPYGKSVKDIESIFERKQVKMAFSYNQFHNASKWDDIYHIPRYAIIDFMPMFYFQWIIK